jgi:uncharacterized lipoprotein YehR (DUF1307 family)
MKKLFLWTGLMISLVLLAACKPELVSTFKETESVMVYLYKTDKAVDRVVDKRVVKHDAAGYKAIVEWAKKNKDNWEPATKVLPPVLLIESKNFSLNVRKDVITFTYKDGTYIRKTNINELVWFKKQLGVIEPP